jgi:hypothetical protein
VAEVTWVERTVDDAGRLWAIVRSSSDGHWCIFGEVWLAPHAHLLNVEGRPAGGARALRADELLVRR